jgi:hypothetical protein
MSLINVSSSSVLRNISEERTSICVTRRTNLQLLELGVELLGAHLGGHQVGLEDLGHGRVANRAGLQAASAVHLEDVTFSSTLIKIPLQANLCLYSSTDHCRPIVYEEE